MQVADLQRKSLQLHRSGAKQTPISWSISDQLKDFLDTTLTSDMRTLETGAGVSTIIFAIKACRHTAIAPDAELFQRIVSYCDTHEIEMRGVELIDGHSEHVLPRMTRKLDLVLIDGRHGFPAPFIDWYHTATLLAIGGLMIVDDVHLWTGKVLKEFLEEDPAWQLYESLGRRSAVFRKLKDGSQNLEWNSQPFVKRRSVPPLPTKLKVAAGYGRAVWALVKQGELSVLAKKVGLKVRS